MHGGSTSLAFNLNSHLGLVFDFGGFRVDSLQFNTPGAGFSSSRVVDAGGNVFTFLFGPRVSFRNHGRFTPFLQVLGGAARASEVTLAGCTTPTPACIPLPQETAFAMTAGGGLDFTLNHRIALRLLQAEYLLTAFQDPTAATENTAWQSNVRLSTGIVLRFGGNPPPPPPPSAAISATCSADRESVYAGSGDFVVVRAQTSDSGNYPLNYSWSASEGAVDGAGPEVRWNSSDRRPGTYTIAVRVYDDRNGTAECSANIRVESRPNRPPTIRCSAGRSVVTVGEPVEISATASDPDDDPLSFSWTANGRNLQSSGPSLTLQTANLPPGSYAITGHVDDGRAGTAECSLNVDVRAAQPPAEVKELETRLALHSIYFPTGRPTAANPAAGVVESQQTVLLLLATDFNRYLTFNPQAHLILEGHADRRGSLEYNKDLTDRRVDRAKSFLVEHGVPAANIETQSLGKQDNLDAEQVKQLVEQNPDLTNEERQQIEGNLQVIVLANNRRVDISLNTTGQQSVRQYPFNAKDSLTLLSTQGGEGEKPARPRATQEAPRPERNVR